MAKQWFIVRTYSGYEEKVRADILAALEHEDEAKQLKLNEYIDQVVVPTEPVEVGGVPKGRKKFFPGYILVHMELNEKTQNFIRHRQYVTGFVGAAGKPRPLAESEVAQIMQQIEQGAVKKEQEVQFEEGMTVRIKDGPFLNFSGVIEEVRNDKKKLRVVVTIFGRGTPVEVDFGQVERV
jgi:transcriptional antiterminator NusG